MSMREKIIEWALKQDKITKELIFRALKSNEVIESDVLEVVNLVKVEVGLLPFNSDAKAPDFNALNVNFSKSNDSVLLKNIRNLSSVNTLQDGSVVPFYREGLTVIYGENGSGKSGIAKVLKSACNARAREVVLPDIYADGEFAIPSATLEYYIGEDVQTFDWKSDYSVESPLNNIHVFDSKSADVQLTNKNEISFMPSGGHVFGLIFELIRQVKTRLSEELKYDTIPVLSTAILVKDTSDKHFAIYNSLKNLEEEKLILENVIWDEQDELKLQDSEALLANSNLDQNQKNKLRLEKILISISDFKNYIENQNHFFCDSSIQDLNKIIEDLKSKEDALDLLGKKLGSLNVFEGVGGAAWRELYEAARKYSEELAYKGKKFPFLEIDSKCVLCNQVLKGDAVEKFKSFDEIMNNQIKKELEGIKKILSDKIQFLDLKLIEPKAVLEAKVEFFKDFLNEENLAQIILFLSKSTGHSKLVRDCLSEKKQIQLTLIEENDEVLNLLNSIKSKVDLQLADLTLLLNPVKITSLKNDIAVLKFRKELFAYKDSFLKVVQNNRHNALINKGISLLNPANVSKASNTIISSMIKKDFLDTFKVIAEGLGISRLPVSMNTSGGEGKVYFDVILQKGKLPKKSKITDVFSEGELKIISLAAFLAEVSISKVNHAIIFDDPVTSLDHKYKEKIAKKLVETSLNRQVVIFTHDISFLKQLTSNGIEFGTKGGNLHINRFTGRGMIGKQDSWDTLIVRDMITYIENEKLSVLRKDMQLSQNNYNLKAGEIYGLLRETWEKVVEEILLNNIVTRLSYEISTQMLAAVKIEDEDYQKVYQAMKKCSRWMIGHKDSENVDSNRPDTKEIQKDIDSLREYIKKKNKEKEAVQKQRKTSVEKMTESELG